MITIVTPYPPTVNHYYGNRPKGGKYIKSPGIAYRAATREYVDRYKLVAPDGRLQVAIEVFPPDNRKRDLDNVGKACLDALQHAGVYADDCLIDDLRFTRMKVVKDGMLRIFISQYRVEHEEA